jgi:DNA polymerase elongation subunit (family B)
MNSIYGVLGNENFRMYHPDLAETITITGQEIIKFAQVHASNYLKYGSKDIKNDFELLSTNKLPYIIYGDTDSLFLNMGTYLEDNCLISDKTNVDKITELVLDKCKDTCEFLNNDLLNRFAKLHNINPEYSKYHLKQEVIAKKSLFFNAKKKYVLHLINKDGRPCDEYDSKGIVTRRSDYPNYTKESVKELLEMILKSEKINFEQLTEYINKVEENMYKMIISGDKRIAKPVSYNKKSEDYKNGKKPYQVLGMDLWNTLEYEYFQPGTKGYLFNILGVDQQIAPQKVLQNLHKMNEKNKTIALPFEEDQLPNYYVIDVQSMMKFCWTNRVAEIMNPITGIQFETLELDIDE